LLIDKMQVYTK